MTLCALFYNPITLPMDKVLWLLLPLCASVALTYKTLRAKSLRRLPLQAVGLYAYMIVGLVALAVVLWLIRNYI
jgi:hypothetical protein